MNEQHLNKIHLKKKEKKKKSTFFVFLLLLLDRCSLSGQHG